MDNEEIRVWGMHTLDDHLFLDGHVIAIGWKAMGDLSQLPQNRDAYKKRYIEVFPDEKKGSVATCTGMIYRFVCEAKIGDYVVLPSKVDKMINIGVIEGDYTFVPDAAQYPHQKKVKWLKHYPRTMFSQGALYELGAFMTFFSVKNYTDEFLAALDKNFKRNVASAGEDETVAATAEDIKQNTRDYVLKELSRQFKGFGLEEVVAALLRAMGYRAVVSSKGGDRGVDITAYKDELPPRILVQVKSKDAPVAETTVHALKGAMREGDYGLFITLSDYTPHAQLYLDNNPIIRGINGRELVELILKYYDKLPEKWQKAIPLEMVYIPVAKDDDNSSK